MSPSERAAQPAQGGPAVARRAAILAFLIGACAAEPDAAGPSGAGSGATPPPTTTPITPTGGATAPIGGAPAVTPTGGMPPLSTGGVGALAGNGGDVTGEGGSTAVVPTGGTGGAPALGSPDWAMIGYDASSTYRNVNETKLTKENVASLTEIWSDDLIGNVYGAPLQIGDKIYASGASLVRAYDAATGNPLWTADVGSTASMGYADGVLYVNTTSGQVVAVDAASGDVKWMKQPGAARADGSGSPVIAGDLVFVGGANGGAELTTGAFRGYLAALNRMTGDVAWLTHTVPESASGASIWSSVAADASINRVYATTGNNYGAPATDTSDAFIAFDTTTGDIVWKNQRTEGDTFGGFARTGGPDYDFGANPVLYETLVGGVMTQLISSGAKSGDAHAVRRDDGMLVWTRKLCEGKSDGSRGIFVNATWSGTLMLFACNEGGPATLYGLDGATGDITWMRALPGQVWGRMSVANGVGFVGTGEALEAFDVDTGALIKSFPSSGGTVAGTITIANGRVAFGEGLSWSSGKRGSTLHVLAVP